LIAERYILTKEREGILEEENKRLKKNNSLLLEKKNKKLKLQIEMMAGIVNDFSD
jgi:hypothetical protein